MGVRDDEYLPTGRRHIPELRKRRSEPQSFVQVETGARAMKGEVAIRADLPRHLVRVPHGW